MTPAALEAVQQAVTTKDAAESFDLNAAQQSALNQQALQKLIHYGLLTAGIGAGARGAVGLYNMTRRNLLGHKAKPLGPVAVDVPVPIAKQANGLFEAGKNFMQGSQASTVGGLPYFLPAAMLVGAGGLAAGWGGVDHVLDQRRKAQMDEELEQAKQQYDQALLQQYDKPRTGVVAEKLGMVLDQLFDTLDGQPTKQAVFEGFGDVAGKMTGGYLALATLLAGLTAKGTYDAVKRRQPGSLLAAAQKRREQKMYANQPTPLFANPAPQPQSIESPKQQLLQAAHAPLA